VLFPIVASMVRCFVPAFFGVPEIVAFPLSLSVNSRSFGSVADSVIVGNAHVLSSARF
jgi:hypothetical protein